MALESSSEEKAKERGEQNPGGEGEGHVAGVHAARLTRPFCGMDSAGRRPEVSFTGAGNGFRSGYGCVFRCWSTHATRASFARACRSIGSVFFCLERRECAQVVGLSIYYEEFLLRIGQELEVK